MTTVFFQVTCDDKVLLSDPDFSDTEDLISEGWVALLSPFNFFSPLVPG